MSKNLFITGTDTDVGKTYISALINKKLLDAGCKATYYKAAMSGNTKDEKGTIIPGDGVFVHEFSHMALPSDEKERKNQNLKELCPFVYETAVSPHLAGRLENKPFNMNTAIKGFEKLSKNYDYITLEGSGGIACPLYVEDDKILLLEDFIKALDLNCIMVASSGLGTINHILTAIEYMKNRNVNLKGIILNEFETDNFLHIDNYKTIERLTPKKILTCVKKGDKELQMSIDDVLCLYE